MDEYRFDHLTRMLSGAATRRGAARWLASLPFIGVLIALLGEEAEAGRRRRRKHRHNPGQDKENRKGKRNGKDTGKRNRKPKTCTPDCAGKACGSDGCGGSCAPGCVAPAVCSDQGQCLPSHCIDDLQNGDETDVDCGGSCPPCADGHRCLTAADCRAPAACVASGADHVCISCALTAECQAALADGSPVRCCDGGCVVGNCCRSADCVGNNLICASNHCLACPWLDPTCDLVERRT